MRNSVQTAGARPNQRYHLRRMLRTLVATSVVVVFLGCSGPSKKTPTKPDTSGATGDKTPVNNKIGKGAVKPSRPGHIGFADCDPGPCMYHRGGKTYHLCLSANAGMCFHFGRTCAPTDRCMLDASSGTYKSCTTVGEGRCLQFGSACEPGDKCMLDVKDNVYRTCESASDGKCVRYGAACLPAG